MISVNKFLITTLFIIAMLLGIAGCNKEVEQFPDITVPQLTGKGLAATIAANTSDSLFYRLVVRSGMVNQLNNLEGGQYTVLVPDNDAMIASGFNGAMVNGIPTAMATAIVQYHIIPQKITSAMITASFPNKQYPTMIILDPANTLVRMTTFFSKNGTQYYVNNIPLGTMDVAAANGVIQKPLRLVAPPSTTLKSAMNAESDLSLFRALVTRADEGQTGLNKFDSLLNYGVTNMTVLAPNNAALKGFIHIASGGVIPLAAPDAVFVNFIGTMLPAADARGLVAYHIAASINPVNGKYEPNIRVFSTNVLPNPAATFIKTMVNSSVPIHPGIMVKTSFTGPFGTGLSFTQAAPLATPFSAPAANAISLDKHAVNGVYHIIDRVLMPQ